MRGSQIHITARDEGGRAHILVIREQKNTAGSHVDSNAEVPGSKTIRTADGLAVDYRGRGRYQVVVSGQILTGLVL